MRVILYTGKGGVGKTTVAAATALRAAQRGYPTVVLSTDPAHSLSDSFDVPLGPDPVPIADGLWGQEVDVLREIEQQWGAIQSWITALLAWQGVSDILASEIAVLPCMDELAGLLHILNHYEGEDYYVVIVDCAPTGETLRLLSFPEMARWYMERIFPMERRALNVIRPVLRPFIKMPMPSDEVFDAVKSLFDRLAEMHTILSDPSITSVRLVVNPERMVIKETQRTYTYLNLYGYFTDLIVCNRILPSTVQDPYFPDWRSAQERNMTFIEESFGGVPLLPLPLMRQEVMGLEMLQQVGDALYQDTDPTVFQRTGYAERVVESEDGFKLILALPFVEKQDVSLVRNGDELIVQAGHYRRNIMLPRVLATQDVGQAHMENGELTLRFHARQESPRP